MKTIKYANPNLTLGGLKHGIEVFKPTKVYLNNKLAFSCDVNTKDEFDMLFLSDARVGMVVFQLAPEDTIAYISTIEFPFEK